MHIFWLSLLAPALLLAQAPRVAVIDFYGLRRIPEERIRKSLGFKEGDALPSSKGDLEDRLEQVPGIVAAHLEAVCCEEKGAILFVGIEEKGSTHFAFRSAPLGSAVLPEEIVAAYRKFSEKLEESVRKGDPAEDAEKSALKAQFTDYAKAHLNVLRDVLRNSADEDHRAMAAHLIAYADKKGEVVNDLQYAMQDSDEIVRANAVRELTAIADYAAAHPEAEVKISPTWFVEMLNSISWSDRNKAALELVSLTENRSGDVIPLIRERALPSVVEMARWKSLTHALPAYILLGRIGGLSEKQIQDTWTAGQRETVIKEVLRSKPGKSR